MKALTPRMVSILRRLGDGKKTSCNWAGTPVSARKGLVDRGLAINLSKPAGTHWQHATYQITELGLQVLGGIKFDEGLTHGYAKWCEVIDWNLSHDWEQALIEDREWEIEHGLRYRESRTIEADVHAVLWKHVRVET